MTNNRLLCKYHENLAIVIKLGSKFLRYDVHKFIIKIKKHYPDTWILEIKFFCVNSFNISTRIFDISLTDHTDSIRSHNLWQYFRKVLSCSNSFWWISCMRTCFCSWISECRTRPYIYSNDHIKSYKWNCWIRFNSSVNIRQITFGFLPITWCSFLLVFSVIEVFGNHFLI